MGFLNNYSPLRYPGGKAAIAGFFVRMLDQYAISSKGTYCEPFAGGAGVALTLLLTSRVSNIVINDYDKSIVAFWLSVINETEALIDMIERTNISIKEWDRQRSIYKTADNLNLSCKQDCLLLGFAVFYLNRCNRAGILPKAGPIGGRSQRGKYKIDARFIKERLITRIQNIARFKDNIQITHLDAIEFLQQIPKITSTPNDTFLYLDPPYYHKGEKLYLNAYKHEDHLKLARFINDFSFCPWIMTYDDCPEVRDIYGSFSDVIIEQLPINYSMQKVRKTSEILIHK